MGLQIVVWPITAPRHKIQGKARLENDIPGVVKPSTLFFRIYIATCILMLRSAAFSGRQKWHTAFEQTNLFWNHPGCCVLTVVLVHCAWTYPQIMCKNSSSWVFLQMGIENTFWPTPSHNPAYIKTCTRSRTVTRCNVNQVFSINFIRTIFLLPFSMFPIDRCDRVVFKNVLSFARTPSC